MRRILLDVSDFDQVAMSEIPSVGERMVILGAQYEVLDKSSQSFPRTTEGQKDVELLLLPCCSTPLDLDAY
jgi:hypothetical protein